MNETIMQCCYTNSTQKVDGKVSSGWKVVAATPTLPMPAYAQCEKLLSKNSSITSSMTDESGKVLNLLEISGDGSYLYVSRSKYGSLDLLGRANMFAHAYIFPCKAQEEVSDPNRFVTLDRSNFAATEEEAAVERSQLVRATPLTIESALQAAGMGASEYLTLIRCVYAQYCEKRGGKPLFIQYDGSDENMQSILYAIYYGLPFGVRRHLMVASAVCNGINEKNIVFSQTATTQDCFVDPRTGRNNVLNNKIESKLERYGFVDYALTADVDPLAYFAALEAKAMELGDPTADNELILKIAHQIMVSGDYSKLSEKDLDNRVADALRSKSQGSQAMDEYIAELLEEIRKREMFLTDATEDALAERLAVTENRRFMQAGEQYNIFRMSTMTMEDAAGKLAAISATAFERYKNSLLTIPQGMDILDYYYANYSLTEDAITWEGLEDLLVKTAYLSKRQRTLDMIDSKAWALYREALTQKGQTIPVFHKLIDLMQKMYPGSSEQFKQSAAQLYWQDKKVTDFCLADLSEYRLMSGGNDFMCQLYSGMHLIINDYRTKDEEAFLMSVLQFFRDFRNYIAENRLQADVIQTLETEINTLGVAKRSLKTWMEIAALSRDQEVLRYILNAKKQLLDGNYEDFVSTFEKVISVSTMIRHYKELMGKVTRRFLKICYGHDGQNNPIPLDVWLIIGSANNPTSFEIFDSISEDKLPAILQMDSGEVVAQSQLLTREEYVEQAEVYCQNKGAEAKTVRKWLSEIKAAEKRRKQEEKKSSSARRGSQPQDPEPAGKREWFYGDDSESSHSDTGSRKGSGKSRDEGQKKGFLSGLFGGKKK